MFNMPHYEILKFVKLTPHKKNEMVRYSQKCFPFFQKGSDKPGKSRKTWKSHF